MLFGSWDDHVELEGSANLRCTHSLSFLVGQCLSRSILLTVMPVDEGRQGLEESMLIVLLGSEDVLVALGLLAHLTGNCFGERLYDTLLCEVPALCDEDVDDAVELSMLRGPDVR